jgi:PIN domain nuclease of toxin-antitoxin system
VRLLLDTHALIWWISDNSALSATAYDAIGDADSQVYVSAASAWEIATKHRLGKLPVTDLLAADLSRAIADEGFTELAISVRDGQAAGKLPGPLRDPFDRMLIAQAFGESLTLVSNERLFDRYGISRLW